MGDWIDIFWRDLTPEAQQRIETYYEEDGRYFDKSEYETNKRPIAVHDISNYEEGKV